MTKHRIKPQRAPDPLTELADNIRLLTDPTTVTSYREVVHVNGKKRTRIREPYTVTLPSLIAALHAAIEPVTSGDLIGSASFESRPPIDLEPIRVLGLITAESDDWAVQLGGSDVDGRSLSRLVALAHPCTQHEKTRIAADAARWVRLANEATGREPSPFTLNQPCPHCWARNRITIAGDLKSARCGRCKREWDHDTIGLLGNMLSQSSHQETLAAPPCPWVDCYRTGDHVEHWTRDGRSWRDTCDVTCA